MPEVASRHHLELVNPVVDAALAEAGVELARRRLVRGHPRPGADRRAAGRGQHGEGARRGDRASPLAGVDHLHGHVAANFLEPEPLEPPFLCLIASGGHTLLAGVDRPRRVRGARPDARRRGRRGARQGGAAARASATRAAPAIERAAARRRPGGVRVPGRDGHDPRLDFSFSGLKTALVYAVRDSAPSGRASAAPTSRRSFQAAVVGQLVAKLERALDAAASWRAVALGGGVAANALLRERVAELCEQRGLRAEARRRASSAPTTRR